MDFLTDDILIPSLVFINCTITNYGIIPEIGFVGAGYYQNEIDMVDKNNKKICRVGMPKFLANQTVLADQCFYSNTTEFKIIKVYD